VKNEEQISELVADFHPPVVTGLELSIYIPENFSGHYRCLFPSSVLVQQLLSLEIRLCKVMVDVEKYRGMSEQCRSVAKVPMRCISNLDRWLMLNLVIFS
jgi:hypothetical protein